MATIPSDPLFSDQWHLQNTTSGLLDLNVVDVWDDYTGAGVQVAVIDDAVQRTHPDLDGNYSVFKDWDFRDNDTDPTGLSNEDHGTAVAGIIGANEGNGIGGVGVAYDSTIFGFRSLSFQNVTDAIKNASGLLQTAGRNREADVVNMSIGNPFGFLFDKGLNLAALNTEIDNAVVFGRDGLGTILVKSAGNDRIRYGIDRNYDTNASSWNASPHTISIAAVNQNGFVSSYSTHGASVLVSGFGTPGQVVTTDRVGYRSDFSGTSAAAPMVSGVVALMLEANPNLGWRDVQEILAYSARHVGTNVGFGTNGFEEYAWRFNGANNWNGGGLHFSNDYGFGLVDAKAAVRLAETWGSNSQTSANDTTVFRDFLNTSRTINV
ncbi:MAG: S8 family serine peptidase, partial [Symploca sp. SIO3E6]|nr:S8 family serine peptidase [Caldora sp. SIO3E6]